MLNSIRNGSVVRSAAFLVPIALAVVVLAPMAPPVEANMLGGNAAFRGASTGTPVPFDPIALPPVVVGAHNDAGPAVGLQPGATDETLTRSSLQAMHPEPGPFLPSFQHLVTGRTVISNDDQMRAVWTRLFAVPYNASLFDFDASFVVLVGGGLMHPYFGFDVTAVERFEATFNGPFNDIYLEEALAMVATTTLPGVAPPVMDPEWKVAAVEISIADRDDIVLNRQELPLP